MDVEIFTLSEVSQKEKDKYINSYMWNLKNGTDEPLCEAEIETQT